MSGEYQRLIERRDLVERDIEELSEQLAEGEVDETTGSRLMEGYQNELSAVTTALSKLPKPPKSRQGPTPKAKPRPVAKPKPAAESQPAGGRSVQRVVVGSLIVITALSVAIFLAARDTTPDNPGGAAATGPGDLRVDPNAVTNEQLEAVVAENPGIPAMRLALADRYFRAGEFPQAMDHYSIVLESNPAPADETLILARMGWIASSIEHYEIAAEYVAESLEIDPTNTEALLYQGFITLNGLDDPAAAIPQLELALQIPGLSEPVIADLERAIETARARLDS